MSASYSDRNLDSSAGDPRAGHSLVPMLVAGLVLIVIGMIGAWALV
ncbi:MAG TPA: hypothetical protein VFB45_18515 [Pseudolabrys sp.]|nr:hypothetical protein [Pseudolabrys sp.]